MYSVLEQDLIRRTVEDARKERQRRSVSLDSNERIEHETNDKSGK